MTFAGMNYLAVVIAAVVAWLAGAGWYMILGKTWMSAVGITPEKMAAARNQPGAFLPFIYAFVAELVMAWVLAGLLGHLGPLTLRERRDLRRVLLARLRDHDAARQQPLRQARLAPGLDRRRPLAGGAAADGRDHRRHGCIEQQPDERARIAATDQILWPRLRSSSMMRLCISLATD